MKIHEIFPILISQDKIDNHDEIKNELIEFVPDRPGHDFRYSVSNNKLVNLGFDKFTNNKMKNACGRTKSELISCSNWYHQPGP